MKLTTSVVDLVLCFPNAVDILDRYNIDYYCRGSKTLEALCEEKNINADIVLNEIQRTKSGLRSTGRAALDWSPDFLTNVVVTHYGDFRRQTSAIGDVMITLSETCIATEREKLLHIRECFKDLSKDLAAHVMFEEQALFKTKHSHHKDEKAALLSTLQEQHLRIGNMIQNLRHATNNYQLDSLVSSSVKLLLIMLHQFDRELTQRLHLENNILFPKLNTIAH
jgi:regulator of cell morphogenesis and NO signaling